MSNIKSTENNWELSCPIADFGTIVDGYYNSGSGLADDTEVETNEFSVMKIIENATKDDFEKYTDKFAKIGYSLILDNTICDNLYRQYSDGEKIWHVSFIAPRCEVRVVEDVCGVSISDFAYSSEGDTKSVIYQYGLYYDKENRVTDRAVNCGMLYIIRLCDNKLILVDGGHIFQASDKTISELLAFLHKITGTKDGETIRIAAWYLTHAHGDHVSGTAKLFNRYSEQIDLERVMYNFPSFQVRSAGYDKRTTIAKEIVRRLYPNTRFLKLHSGMKFDLANVSFEVFYTHEDAVSSETAMTYDLKDYNCTSTVLKLSFDGASVMLLGDISQAAEQIIAQNFDMSVLKSDVVQVAHHCINMLRVIYGLIKAPIAFMPNSYFGCHTENSLPRLEQVLKYVENDQIYYEETNTVGLAVEDGKFAVVYDEPAFCEEYDFSGF